MTYRVEFEKNSNEYLVIEKDTDYVVRRSPKKRKMYSLVRKLNLGAGFNGFTPGFFVREIPLPKNS